MNNPTPRGIRAARSAIAVPASNTENTSFTGNPIHRIRANTAGNAAVVLAGNAGDTATAGAVTVAMAAGDEFDAVIVRILATSTADLIGLWT